ncbi:MAG: penicillin-binding transpeptidase domain-containing protein [Anaerolineae bacterium]
MSRSLRRVAASALAAFGLLALAITFWSIGGTSLSARDDNPRRFFNEQHIQRGTILDRHDQVLAQSVAISGTYVRRYPVINAAPAVGYYSLNYGLAGIEEAQDALLRGPYDFADSLMHRPRLGGDVRLTLDLDVQRDLAQRLTQHGGAVVVSLSDGAVLAMESHPAFDPNTLDRDWKQLSIDPAAPLLNRVTQGLYQPGSILQTVLLAEAIERHQISLTETLTQPDRPVALDQLVLDCSQAGSVQTIVDAYTHGCPAPFADLGLTWGETELISVTQQWQLTTPPVLDIRTSAAPTLTLALTTTDALQAYATGQGELTVSPLHMVLVASTIGTGGLWPPLHLVEATRRSPNDQWLPDTPSAAPKRLISPRTAQTVLAMMTTNDGVAGHSGVALSGNKRLAWFIGLAPADRPRYAIAVLLEQSPEDTVNSAEFIGRETLKTLLALSPNR